MPQKRINTMFKRVSPPPKKICLSPEGGVPQELPEDPISDYTSSSKEEVTLTQLKETSMEEFVVATPTGNKDFESSVDDSVNPADYIISSYEPLFENSDDFNDVSNGEMAGSNEHIVSPYQPDSNNTICSFDNTYIDYRQYRPCCINVVNGPMGSGKTFALKLFLGATDFTKYYEKPRVLFITSRVINSHMLAKFLSFSCYKDINSYINPDNHPYLVCCVNSLERISCIEKYNIIILDEFVSICTMMTSSIVVNFSVLFNKVKDLMSAYYDTEKKIKKSVFIMDAMIGEREKLLYENFCKEGTFNIINHVLPPHKQPFLRVDFNPNLFNILQNMVKDAYDGHKMGLVTNCATYFEKFFALLSCRSPELFHLLELEEYNTRPLKIKYYSSRNEAELKDSIINGFSDDFDIFAYTPIIGPGISFTDFKVKRVYAIFTPFNGSPKNCVQMLGRIRNNEEQRVVLNIKPGVKRYIPTFEEVLNDPKYSVDLAKLDSGHQLEHDVYRRKHTFLDEYRKKEASSDKQIQYSLLKYTYEYFLFPEKSLDRHLMELLKENYNDIKITTTYTTTDNFCKNDELRSMVQSVKKEDLIQEENYGRKVMVVSKVLRDFFNFGLLGYDYLYQNSINLCDAPVFREDIIKVHINIPDLQQVKNHVVVSNFYISFVKWLQENIDDTEDRCPLFNMDASKLYVKLYDAIDFPCCDRGILPLYPDTVLDDYIIIDNIGDIFDLFVEYKKTLELLNIVVSLSWFDEINTVNLSCIRDAILDLLNRIGYRFSAFKKENGKKSHIYTPMRSVANKFKGNSEVIKRIGDNPDKKMYIRQKKLLGDQQQYQEYFYRLCSAEIRKKKLFNRAYRCISEFAEKTDFLGSIITEVEDIPIERWLKLDRFFRNRSFYSPLVFKKTKKREKIEDSLNKDFDWEDQVFLALH